MSDLAPENDRRTTFGWTMHDWTNSGYSAAIAGAIRLTYVGCVDVGAARESGAAAGMRGGG